MRLKLLFAAGLIAATAGVSQTASTLDHSNLALRPGSWSYTATPTGSEASFMDSTGTAQLVLRCVRANRVVALSLRGAHATTIMVWTSSTSRGLPATFDASTTRLNASLAAGDPLLDALAFSRSRFSFSAGGLSPLVLPAWPEPARAIEDCRN